MTNSDSEPEVAGAKVINFWPGHPLSYTTTRIQIFRNDINLGSATGFVIKYGQMYALVTNWHVLSGYNPANNTCLSKTGALPNRIECHVAVSRSSIKDGRTGEAIYFKPLSISLFADERPVWRDEKTDDAQNDYAVIDLKSFVPELDDAEVSLRSILGGRVALKKAFARGENRLERLKAEDVQNIYPPIGAEVFVLGYPKGISGDTVFPIWKRASIASEPQIPIVLGGRDYRSVFYIDTLTKSGMSGSPVVYLAKPGDRLHGSDGAVAEVTKAEPHVIGVYAGRDGITQEEYELSVGRVWKIEFVEQLIAWPNVIV